MSDAAITPGCIVVITYPASMATSTDLHQQLANQIAATVSKVSSHFGIFLKL